MIQFQKLIKYCAIAFAFFLIFNIISGIIYVISLFSNVSTKGNSLNEFKNLNVKQDTFILNIDAFSMNITIKTGNKLKIESNNKNINFKQANNRLSIKEKHGWFNKTQNSDLIIYVPQNFIFDTVSIESGAGKLNVEQLLTKNLSLELGTGKVVINNLNTLNNTEIDGGAGSIEINNGKINNLDLDMGIGQLSLNSTLIGNNKIDSGVGMIDLNLNGTINDYKIKVDKGIGSVNLNGEKIKGDTYYGTGSNLVDIDGGIGSINIETLD